MSRAINLDVPHADVIAMCEKHNVTISAIEVLPSGGTRVVLMNGYDTALIADAFKSRVIEGVVQRTPLVTRYR
ncbi:hypothetical protein [Sphingomonas lycopersici]|uniref:Uncharacterized protein n=1 Tax=Sphingomonas lycopersici TaxID=2951807 RepID=A0AA41ZBD4_9SPHN|nr:hypothetical protein [Sphingomonas lycopersici]MCW6533784.1 hypothetical protein [Sphingomonas lycopersici]